MVVRGLDLLDGLHLNVSSFIFSTICLVVLLSLDWLLHPGLLSRSYLPGLSTDKAAGLRY